MKTFKQFITETKEKEPVLITNTHGSHAQKKNPNPYNVKESEENTNGPAESTWEHYIKQPHNDELVL